RARRLRGLGGALAAPHLPLQRLLLLPPLPAAGSLGSGGADGPAGHGADSPLRPHALRVPDRLRVRVARARGRGGVVARGPRAAPRAEAAERATGGGRGAEPAARGAEPR